MTTRSHFASAEIRSPESGDGLAESVATPPEPKAKVRVAAPAPATPAATAEPLRVLTNSIGMRLVLIPSGQFHMGLPEADSRALDGEKPQHTVRISKPFYLAVTPVTQEQYERVMGSNPSYFTGSPGILGFFGKGGGPRHPVEQASWKDAVEFCRKLSAREGRRYRLPTEAEWEYACRAGSTTSWCFGNDKSALRDYAWYRANSEGKTHPVAEKKPNAWGLYDMHGNVWEWCSDWFGEYTSTAADDPTGATAGSLRVDRGGSWYGFPRNCRSAFRYGDTPGHRSSYLGFRVASSSVDATGK